MSEERVTISVEALKAVADTCTRLACDLELYSDAHADFFQSLSLVHEAIGELYKEANRQ